MTVNYELCHSRDNEIKDLRVQVAGSAAVAAEQIPLLSFQHVFRAFRTYLGALSLVYAQLQRLKLSVVKAIALHIARKKTQLPADSRRIVIK